MSEHTESLQLYARERRTHTVEVGSPGTLHWEVIVASEATIGLGLTWKPRGGGQEPPWEVQPVLRLGPREGHHYACTSAGELSFHFENSALLGSRAVTLTLSKSPLPPFPAPSASLRVAEDTAALNRLGMHGARLYFTNEFAEAEAFFEVERLRVPVYAISHATIAWLRALMTFESASIAEAHRRLQLAQTLCEHYMGQTDLLREAASGIASLGQSVGGALKGAALSLLGGPKAAAAPPPSAPPAPSPAAASSAYTPIQLEATLIYGEATLLTALLNLMEESLLSLVKCGLNIRSGWATYKLVDRAGGAGYSVMGLQGADEPPLRPGMRCAEPDRSAEGGGGGGAGGGTGSSASNSAATALDVEGGLLFGAGGFNSVASLLPPIVLRILQALDFPNDRGAGLAQLRRCFLGGRIRAPLGGVLLVSMGVLIPSFHNGGLLSSGAEASIALEALLNSLPNSALPLWLAGRKARMQARHGAALEFFDRCAQAAERGLPQLVDLTCYESVWSHASQHDWAAVEAKAVYLADHNNWSKAFYAYLRAVALLEQGRLGEARQAMLSVLTLSSRRIGGKVLPAEQFALKRAAEFCALTLPPLRTALGSDAGGGGGGSSSGVAEAEAEAAILAASSGGFLRRRLPAAVPPGSLAHAAALAYPLVLPGAELLYFFGCFSQMTPPALHFLLHQACAVLRAACSCGVFTPSPAGGLFWGESVGGGGSGGEGGSAWSCFPSPQEVEREAAGGAFPHEEFMQGLSALTAMQPINHAACNSLQMGSPQSQQQQQQPPPASASLWSSSISLLGGLAAKVGSAVTSVVVKQEAEGSAAAASSGSPFSLKVTLSKFARATPLEPVHAAASFALVFGGVCGILGRVDAADAALQWVAASPLAPSLVPREQATAAYIFYERGLLALDISAAKAAAAAAGPPLDMAEGSTREKLTLGCPRKDAKGDGGLPESALARGLTLLGACKLARECFSKAKGIRADFPWKVRLHIRTHLAAEEERTQRAKADALGEGRAAEAEEEEEGEEGGEHDGEGIEQKEGLE